MTTLLDRSDPLQDLQGQQKSTIKDGKKISDPNPQTKSCKKLVRYWSQEKNRSCKPDSLDIPEAAPAFERTISLCTPILTNVATRDGMAIIKIDGNAVSQLKSLTQFKNRGLDLDGGQSADSLPWIKAVTEPFPLRVDPMTEIYATFKLFFDGCFDQEKGKYVSVFVELSDPQGNNLKSPFVVTLFLKNLKDDNGNSFKKSIKLIPSGSRVERGVKDFVSVEKFDKLLEKESIACFGVLVKQLAVKEISL